MAIETVTVTKDQLHNLVFSTLTSQTYEVPPDHATIITDAMLSADLSGHDTHGSQRLPSYLARIRAGVMDPKATPRITWPAPAVAAIDGCNAFGHVAVAAAVDAAIKAAGQFGVGMAGVKRSNHFGAASWVVERAVEKDYAAIVFTNSSPALPPWGGKEKLLGVSPLAAGFPGSSEMAVAGESVNHEHVYPFVLDMAPSVAARGKVIKAARRGEQIPEGWALDANGKMTTDPDKALEGTMLPMGGPKGSALAIFMDVFSGVMTGAAFAGGVASPYDPSRSANVGHFVLVLKPDLFVDRSVLVNRLKRAWESVTNSEAADGFDRVRFPGELEQDTRSTRLIQGIPFTRNELGALNAEAGRVGAATLSMF